MGKSLVLQGTDNVRVKALFGFLPHAQLVDECAAYVIIYTFTLKLLHK